MAPRARGLTKSQILAAFHAKGTHQSIGIELGISPSHVGCIKRGMCHRDITGIAKQPSSKHVITTKLQKAIVSGTDSYVARAKRLGVSSTTIKKYMEAYKKEHPEFVDPRPPNPMLFKRKVLEESSDDRREEVLHHVRNECAS